MNKTKIEWTDLTWNPIRARNKATGKTGTFCTRISPGCQHCYASTINKRFGTGLEYTVPNLKQHEFYLDQRILEQPLKLKKPAKIFVGDMFDLFHDDIYNSQIDAVFNVMRQATWHTFQVLTKRAEGMRDYVRIRDQFLRHTGDSFSAMFSHVWLGVSVESQKYADERIPLLLRTPAAVRFLSVEPLLEAVHVIKTAHHRDGQFRPVDWVICGGESGPGARPFNLKWAEDLRDSCKLAGVPFFLKQLGSKPVRWMSDGETFPFTLNDRKGGDMSEWPEDLRIREFPR